MDSTTLFPPRNIPRLSMRFSTCWFGSRLVSTTNSQRKNRQPILATCRNENRDDMIPRRLSNTPLTRLLHVELLMTNNGSLPSACCASIDPPPLCFFVFFALFGNNSIVSPTSFSGCHQRELGTVYFLFFFLFKDIHEQHPLTRPCRYDQVRSAPSDDNLMPLWIKSS